MTNTIINNLVNLAKKVTIFTIVLSVVASVLSPATVALAQIQEPLQIYNVTVTKTADTATISWSTNRAATGRVEYGLQPNTYTWHVSTNQKVTNQAITVFGLSENKTYYFRVFADDDYSEVGSFEQTFKTGDINDNRAPLISGVSVVFTTGTTATIQWTTDEEATSEIEYGQTTAYGRTVADGRRVKEHDLTISGLTTGAFYHFRVKSKDEDGNVSKWFDMTFRTNLTNTAENTPVEIFSVEPTSTNDIKIGKNSVVISWRTNLISQGWVNYGTSQNLGATVATNAPRDAQHSVTLTGLSQGTTYYFTIKARDIFGREVTSNRYSVTTKSDTVPQSSIPTGGIVLGAATCNINLQTEYGYYGSYYNLPSTHPDMESWKQNVKTANNNDWYDNQYFRFSRVDENIEFGAKFFPLNEGLPGDPNHFAVHWRAMINVPTSGTYTYKLNSDDDSWVFIDGALTSDLKGIHAAQTTFEDVTLQAGWHTLDIYYADRQSSNAAFSFAADNRWSVHPLPDGCSINDVLSYNGTGGNDGVYTGIVLGSSNTDDGNGNGINFNSGNGGTTTSFVQTYACNPNLGYTKILKLYKTSASPDIWALLETGQKHYITSPESFALYQCDWSKVQLVSQKFLDGFANTTLVRTPENPTIYHLFDRPIVKWLKINIPSPTIFVSYANNYWGNVARINHLDLASYPHVELIKGENSPEVYKINGTQKDLFASAEVFERLGYDWVEVATLNQVHLDSYKEGSIIR